MNDIERAISEISDIRSQLAASTRFRGYAPEAVAMVGVMSLGVLIAQLVWPDALAGSNARIAIVWGAVLLTSSATIGVEAISRARHRHGGMAAAMLRGAMLTAVPIGVVCIVLALCLFAFAPDALWILPGAWQMLIGVVSIGSHSTLPRGIIWPGLALLLIGAAVCIISGLDGAVTPVLAGGPIILGHLAISWLLYKEGESFR